MQMRLPSRKLLEKHYRDLSDRHLSPAFVKDLQSGPVVYMVRADVSPLDARRQLSLSPRLLRRDNEVQPNPKCLDATHSHPHSHDRTPHASPLSTHRMQLWRGKGAVSFGRTLLRRTAAGQPLMIYAHPFAKTIRLLCLTLLQLL